ncbi:MAG: tRNA pseudouridine(13) synthase TruD [Planctomycetes bacterium]|nr:tRNA pseudouridine(13) synthase TruD [Planctomycetota bacterium]
MSAEPDSPQPDSSPPEPIERRERYELRHVRPDPLDLPRVAPEIEPIGGRIRVEIEDFEVEEVPLYAPCGEGPHVYVKVRKRNRTTLQIREFLAKRLGVHTEEIGFAGFKDKRAVTTQTFSIHGVTEPDLDRIESRDWIEVLAVSRHKNKLRTGHLKGNRFRIRVRGAREGSADDAKRIVERIRERGLPNHYHGQRFGRNLLGARIGSALLHRDVDAVVSLLLGTAAGLREEFRERFEAGKIAEALAALPPGRAAEAGLLYSLKRYPGNHRAAVRRIPRQLRRMYFSAYQAWLFNWALRERAEWGGECYTLYEGDLAQKRDSGGLFVVEDVEAENERARNREIVPTGPMFGRKMRFPQGRPGAMEWAILHAEGLRPQSFLSHVKGLRLDGTRRQACIWLDELVCEEEAPGVLRFEFLLPSGSYATTLLEQVMGPGQVDALVDSSLIGDEDADSEDGEETEDPTEPTPGSRRRPASGPPRGRRR